MEPTLEDRMQQALNSAIQWARLKESKLLADVLAIQQKIHKIQQVKHVVRKKEVKETVQQQNKQENTTMQFQKKINDMINKVQQEIQEIDNPKKSKALLPPSAKQKNVEPLPQIEKKPPIPSVNRAKQGLPKPNYHYRNKNEVTGKITQTPLKKSSNKVHSTRSVGKKMEVAGSEEKIPQTKNEKVVANLNQEDKIMKKNIKQQERGKEELKAGQSKQARLQNKKTYIQFSNFQIAVPKLIHRAQEAKNTILGSKRETIQNLVSEYNKSQLGYRNKQSASIKQFMNSFNNLAATRSQLSPSGLVIQSRRRQPHLPTFTFDRVLTAFQQLLEANPISEQYAPDPKQIFKIKCWYRLINEYFENQIQATRQSLSLPPKLGINFQMEQNFNIQPDILSDNETDIKNPHLSQFQSLLREQLQELKNMEALDKQALKKLRSLISLGLYDGKRNPIIIQSNKYEEWKDFYEN